MRMNHSVGLETLYIWFWNFNCFVKKSSAKGAFKSGVRNCKEINYTLLLQPLFYFSHNTKVQVGGNLLHWVLEPSSSNQILLCQVLHSKFYMKLGSSRFWEFSLKSLCLHPVFGPPFTPHPLFDEVCKVRKFYWPCLVRQAGILC
jgi:hypothetical protein